MALSPSSGAWVSYQSRAGAFQGLELPVLEGFRALACRDPNRLRALRFHGFDAYGILDVSGVRALWIEV